MRKVFLTIAALTLCVACNKPSVVTVDRLALEVAPSVEQPLSAPSKADSYSYFAPGSQVGIYMVNYNGGTPGTLTNTGNHADNACFTAASDGVLRKTPPVFYPEVDVVQKVDIYAYYPFVAVMTSDVKACPFAVSDDQAVAANVKTSDLCWAKNLRTKEYEGIVPTAKPIAMEFVHKFSKIALALNIPTISANGKTVTGVSNVKFNGVFRSVTLDLATGGVTLKNTAADSRSSVTPTAVQVGAPGGAQYKYDVIVPAQAFPLGYSLVSFDLTYSDGTSSSLSYKVTNATFGSSAASLAGKLHKISLTLTSALELKLTGSQITDWTAGTSSSGIVDNLVSTSFKVTIAQAGVTVVNRVKVTTDFEGDFDIKTGVTLAGQVCKFKFEAGRTPRDYGFRITKLVFMNGDAEVSTVTKTSGRVYTTGEMDLGTW